MAEVVIINGCASSSAVHTTQCLRHDSGLVLDLVAFSGSRLFPESSSFSFPTVCIFPIHSSSI